jgi:hypothetical protein
MRENRSYGSEGGEGKTFPTPIKWGMGTNRCVVWLQPAPAIAKRRLFAL